MVDDGVDRDDAVSYWERRVKGYCGYFGVVGFSDGVWRIGSGSEKGNVKLLLYFIDFEKKEKKNAFGVSSTLKCLIWTQVICKVIKRKIYWRGGGKA